MADHRRRTRAFSPLLALAAVAVLVAGAVAGVRVTGAYFTTGRTIQPGSLQSGNLDVVLDGDTDDIVSVPGLTLADMLPGDSRATTISVANAGTARLRFSISGRATGGLAGHLQVQVWRGGTAINTGTTTTGYSGSCSSTDVVVAQTTLTATDATLLGVAASEAIPAITTGSAQVLCVRLTIPTTVPSAAQGQTSTAVLSLVARSVS